MHILMYSGTHFNTHSACTNAIVPCSCISLCRLRKLIADYEAQIRNKDALTDQLTCEVERLKKDADVQARTLRELKEILQTHVNPTGPAQVRHRAGDFSAP